MDTDDGSTAIPLTRGDTKEGIVYCGSPVNFSLIEYGGSASYGTLTVGNDGGKLYVTFVLNADWVVYKDIVPWTSGADLFVGTETALLATQTGTIVNDDGTGHFYYWSFPYQLTPTVGQLIQSHTFEVNRSTIITDCPLIVFGVKIRNLTTNEIKWVEAVANTKCLGYWIEYCMQSCGGEETAYAKSTTSSTCFLNLPPPGASSNNWGWTNAIPAPASGTVTFHWPVYAGAGQCDISNGTLVGYLDGTYNGANVYVTYNLFGGFHLYNTQLWVGNTMLPVKKGKFVTAPGQFPYKHSGLNGVLTDSFGPIPITGDIYISAHADVSL